MRIRIAAAACAGVLLLLPVVSAQAAFPGANGRIAYEAYESDDLFAPIQIFTVSLAGSVEQVTAGDYGSSTPAWSPDGARISFGRAAADQPNHSGEIFSATGEGTDVTRHTFSPAHEDGSTWSPDGQRLAFVRSGATIYAKDMAGSPATLIATPGPLVESPAWSPSGNRIAVVRKDPFYYCDDEGCYNDYGHPDIWTVDVASGEMTPLTSNGRVYGRPSWSPDGRRITFDDDADVWVMDADGGGKTNLTVGAPSATYQTDPAWSPDGSRIAFVNWSAAGRDVYTMDLTGGDWQQVTTDGRSKADLDWQPVQRPYPRPKSALANKTTLVTAFEPCTQPNREHGPPLAYGSCHPPVPASPNLIVSVGETRQSSIGFVRTRALVGEAGGTDDSDIQMRLLMTNVMKASDRSDYTGVLHPELTVRLTDRDGFQAQTTQDFPLGFDVPCVATDNANVGGLCDLTTTADAIAPGAVGEGTRAIWALDQVKVYDGGPTGDGANRSLFAVQGIFVP